MCDGKVEYDLACHTYPQTKTSCENHLTRWSNGKSWCLDCNLEPVILKVTWMACMPCDSATRYDCRAHNENRCDSDCEEYDDHEGCGWTWTLGLNTGNPRAVDNETRNPRWGEDELK